MVVVVALGHGEQLGKVARGQDLAQAGDHDVADVTADVLDEVADRVRGKKGNDQPHDGTQGVASRRPTAQRVNDGVGGFPNQEWRDKRQHRGDSGGEEDTYVEGPECGGTASDAQNGIHGV